METGVRAVPGPLRERLQRGADTAVDDYEGVAQLHEVVQAGDAVRLGERLLDDRLEAGGQFFVCGTCLRLRGSSGSEVCPLSTLKDHYEIVRDSDRLVTV